MKNKLIEQKIRRGDKVRCIVAEDYAVKLGKIYTVLKVDSDKTVLVKLNKKGDSYWLDLTSVELVSKTLNNLGKQQQIDRLFIDYGFMDEVLVSYKLNKINLDEAKRIINLTIKKQI